MAASTVFRHNESLLSTEHDFETWSSTAEELHAVQPHSFEVGRRVLSHVLLLVNKLETLPRGAQEHLALRAAYHTTYPGFLPENGRLRCIQFPGCWQPMSNPGSEQSSNAAEYSIRRDTNGRLYRSYHPRNPQIASSTQEDYDATTPRSELRSRRPSETIVTGGGIHHAPAGRGQGRESAIVYQTFPGPGSPPGHFELSRPPHGAAAPPSTSYAPNAFGFMASAPLGQSALSASPPKFASSLTGVALGFAAIDARDYKNCEKYIRANPEILRVDPKVFIEQAFDALKAGKDAYAKCCVQQSLLLRECQGESAASQRTYFDKFLRNSDKVRKAAEKEFLIDRDEALKRLRDKLLTSPAAAADSRGELSDGVASLSLGSRLVVPPGGLLFSSTGPGHPQQQSAGRGEGPRGGQDMLSNAPTFSGEMMDENYVVKDSSFFTVGRVFAILWHTNIGGSVRQNQKNLSNDRRSGMMQTGRFGELIISHIQRMVVVKREHGCCWCIPVNTYNGKGVAKKGFSASDRAAHSIIYMNDQSPVRADDEHDISKRAIMVIPADDDQKLDPMSRLNFGKVHTVEHNVRVMPVGRVDPKSLPYFEAYWEAKAKESFRNEVRKPR